MNTSEMLAQLRLDAMLEDSAPDYTDTVLLGELYDALCTKFQKMILDARRGYWLHSTDRQIGTGTNSIRLPPRATSLSKVMITNGDPSESAFVRLHQVQEGSSELFEQGRAQTGPPRAWANRGDRVALLPAADASGYWLRIWYYLRPSRLVLPQSSTRGLVTAVNTSARTITVNAIPYDMTTAVQMASGTQKIDVVHPDGWHELAVVDAPQTYSGLTFTVGGSDSIEDVEAGDFVRVAGQTEWAPIPEDFHRALTDIAAVKILMQRTHHEKAVDYAQNVSADMERFSGIISNRVREEPRVIRATLPSLRRRVLV